MILNKDNYLNVDLNNKIIIFPTDTVYGIGCLYKDIESIKRIYAIKGRDFNKPMVVFCADYEQLNLLIKKEQPIPKKLKKYWPGKLTIIFFKNEYIYDIITSSRKTIGVRMPGNEISLNLLKKFGPMVVTSLNISKSLAITKYSDALKFADQVDYIIEGGDLDASPSTIYDLTEHKILRQGDVIIN